MDRSIARGLPRAVTWGIRAPTAVVITYGIHAAALTGADLAALREMQQQMERLRSTGDQAGLVRANRALASRLVEQHTKAAGAHLVAQMRVAARHVPADTQHTEHTKGVDR